MVSVPSRLNRERIEHLPRFQSFLIQNGPRGVNILSMSTLLGTFDGIWPVSAVFPPPYHPLLPLWGAKEAVQSKSPLEGT